MSQSTRGERITAAVSALAAVVILGAAVTAQQSRTAPVNPLARLESDLRFQLYLAHRTDGGVLAQRLTELNDALDARDRFYGAMIGATHGEPFRAPNTPALVDPVDHFRRNATGDAFFFEALR